MTYFVHTGDMQELRKEYHSHCLKMHPDKGGEHRAFVEMQNEYEQLFARLAAGEAGRANESGKRARFTTEGERAIMEMIDRLMAVPGIVIEICGTWLWVGGNTFPVHERIKGFGFKFSRQKRRWYWSPYLGEKRRRGRYSMDKIRARYGSEVIESEAQTVLELSAA